MNTTQAMRDPAAGINVSLLPHMHLISKNRYPITNNPALETIVGYLLEAPKIVRDLQPMQWQFLDAPADGTLILTWQPTEQLGTNFASDGYVYGDVEQSFKSDVRGYTLEMFQQRSGYRSGEQTASHSRKRYRLLPSNPAMPSVDPALFIVHYCKAHGGDTIPAAQIPILPHIAQQINQRRAIQAQGQLARKDFMLHDRSNWPQINPPHGMGRVAPGHRRGPSMGNETTIEEEEDVSRGDILDFMTPRDISKVRYEQHHEWMEEVLESPYHIHQIIPGDLGLGRKGELEELTKDFFDAPTAVVKESSGTQPASVGEMAEDRAEDFKKRATQKIAQMQAEIDRMKQQHAKRMAKMQRTTLLNSAERRLRSAPTTASGRTMSTGSVADQQDIDPLEEIAQEVESSIGKKIERVATVTIVSRGGLQERHTERTFSTSSASRPVVSPVKNTASPTVTQSAFSQQTQGAVQQQHVQYQAQAGANSEDLPEPEPVANGGPEQDLRQESEATATGDNEDAEDGDLPPLDDMGMDVDMEALVNDDDEDDDATPAGNDWVMVDGQAERSTVEAETDSTGIPQSAVKPEDGQGQQEDSAGQAQPPAPVEEQAAEDSALDDNDFGGDFDNVDVDTAGDALASYEDGDDEDLNLDAMDDSAFGDAFHPDEDADIS